MKGNGDFWQELKQFFLKRKKGIKAVCVLWVGVFEGNGLIVAFPNLCLQTTIPSIPCRHG